MRNWREVDVDEMAADLLRLDLIVSPPDDLESMIDSYNSTLRALVDKHVPLRTKGVPRTSLGTMVDRECRESKRLTRKLERRYRRVRTTDAKAAWRQQFHTQRHLFQSKFTAFWLSTVKAVSKTRTSSGEPSTPCFTRRGSKTHANCLQLILPVFFRSKVANIRTAGVSAKPPCH